MELDTILKHISIGDQIMTIDKPNLNNTTQMKYYQIVNVMSYHHCITIRDDKCKLLEVHISRFKYIDLIRRKTIAAILND